MYGRVMVEVGYGRVRIVPIGLEMVCSACY